MDSQAPIEMPGEPLEIGPTHELRLLSLMTFGRNGGMVAYCPCGWVGMASLITDGAEITAEYRFHIEDD